jgi:spermidine/putrescine-binding protein
MGEAEFESDYQAVQVDLDFQRFATVKPHFLGERIGYGITIPSNAPHSDEAALFIAFLLGPEGRTIMAADYHPLFDHCPADGYADMPKSLQDLCVPADAP